MFIQLYYTRINTYRNGSAVILSTPGLLGDVPARPPPAKGPRSTSSLSVVDSRCQSISGHRPPTAVLVVCSSTSTFTLLRPTRPTLPLHNTYRYITHPITSPNTITLGKAWNFLREILCDCLAGLCSLMCWFWLKLLLVYDIGITPNFKFGFCNYTSLYLLRDVTFRRVIAKFTENVETELHKVHK